MNTSVGLRGGPEWRNQTAYAVEAQASQPSTQRQFQAMLRTLLEDRFGLKVHNETDTGKLYALVLDRSDGKLGPNVSGYEVWISIWSVWREAMNWEEVTVDWKVDLGPDGRTIAASKASDD